MKFWVCKMRISSLVNPEDKEGDVQETKLVNTDLKDL